MEDILFLALCGGLPILMVFALLWLAIGALREWWAVRSVGWDVGAEDEAKALVASAPTLRSRLALRVRRRGEFMAFTSKSEVKGGTRSAAGSTLTSHLLIWPVANVGHGLIAVRTGGLFEQTVEHFAPSTTPSESWAWARVHGPVDASWLTDERGKALGAVLNGDLYLLGDHVALTGPTLSALMTQADALRAPIDKAIGPGESQR